MKPASSSQAYSVFSSGEARGTPVWLACERIARRISSSTPRSARIGLALLRMLFERGVDLPIEIVQQRRERPFCSSSPRLRA